MDNITTITNKVYRQYADKLSASNTILDLDITNPNLQINHRTDVEKFITAYLDYCLEKPLIPAQQSTITLAGGNNKLQIKDDTRLLTTDEQDFFRTLATTSHLDVKIRVRLGFGTVININNLTA